MKARNPKDLSLLTLTIRNVPKPSKKVIRKLIHDFEKFRERKYVRSRVRGGIWVIEVKRGKDKLWNLHIHSLIEHSWFGSPRLDEAPRQIPERLKDTKGISSREDLINYSARDAGQVTLSALWEEITGDPVLDIRKVGFGKEALRYIIKYLLKPPKLKPRDAVEFLHAFFSLPLIKSFGTWYNAPHPELRLICPQCGGSDWEILTTSWFLKALINSYHLIPP